MSTTPTSALVDLIEQNEQELLAEWLRELDRSTTRRPGLLSREDLERDAREFLGLLRESLRSGTIDDGAGPGWDRVHDRLAKMSRTRAEAGFSPSETATFVFSLKQPLFGFLAEELRDDAEALARGLWEATTLLDGLGLRTTEEYQQAREEVIERQQQELLELSTPVVKLWDGVLALPLIGTLDSERTQVVMETLLQRIVETGLDDRDHRHHRRADRRHARRAASAEDRGGRPADGGRLHHQRHPPADRPDDRPPRRRPRRGHDQGDAGRRVRARPASATGRRRSRGAADGR